MFRQFCLLAGAIRFFISFFTHSSTFQIAGAYCNLLPQKARRTQGSTVPPCAGSAATPIRYRSSPYTRTPSSFAHCTAAGESGRWTSMNPHSRRTPCTPPKLLRSRISRSCFPLYCARIRFGRSNAPLRKTLPESSGRHSSKLSPEECPFSTHLSDSGDLRRHHVADADGRRNRPRKRSKIDHFSLCVITVPGSGDAQRLEFTVVIILNQIPPIFPSMPTLGISTSSGMTMPIGNS